MSPEEAGQEGPESDNRKSQFQHLWAEAESLARENDALEQALDELVKRVNTEIFTAEQAMGETIRQVVYRQIKFSRRKSLLKWQRTELNEWIGENLYELDRMGLIDEPLADELARKRADDLNIEIDEHSDLSPAQQMNQINQMNRLYSIDTEELIDLDELDDFQTLIPTGQSQRGPDPSTPSNPSFEAGSADRLDDLEQDDSAYIEALEDVIDDDMVDMFDDFFDEHETAREQWTSPDNESGAQPALSPALIKRLFRQTAAALHPDKEPDEQQRAKKQVLMTQLLKARDDKDLITLISLHNKYTTADSGLGRGDERTLEGVLLNYLEQQESRRRNIIRQTPMHELVFERFYHQNPAAVRRKIDTHLEQIQTRHDSFLIFINQITNLRSLKRLLKIRYDSLTARDDW